MEKIKADYVSANKAFEAKYVEVTEQMDPTFMGSVLTLANAFVGMKEKYEKLSYLEERVAVLERRVESSKPATTNVVKEGYLNMKTTFSWQREYFVIKEGKLFHLNAGKVATPYVITSARLYNQKASGMKLSDAERCVEVTCDRKKNSIVLQAQSKRERDAWLTELLSVVVSAPPPPQPSPSTPSQSQSSQSPQPSQSQSQAGGDSGDSEGGVKLGLLKLKTRLAGAGSVSNSGRRPRSGSPDSTAVMVSWEELKGSELRQPVSYSRRASGGKGEARSVRIAGVPPWALSLVAKSAGSNSSSGAERLPFFPPLTLGCFYRDHAYTESKGSTTPQVDRPDEALSITSFENDGSELSFHEDASDASSSAFSAVSPAPSGDLQQHKSTQMPAENTSNEPASRAPPGSQQMDSEFSSGIATAAGGGDGSSSSSSSTSTNTNSNSNSSNNSTNNSNSNNNNTSVSATTPSQTSQQYYATTIQYSNRKHTAISRRKKFPVEEEAPESNDGIAIDTDKVTEGITFAELVQRLAKTNQMITVISTESQKMCDLAKLNIAMQALHNVKCSLAFMTDEPFVPAASVDDARAQISGAVSELRDTIKEIATSLKLVVPDNSSSWAFYVQPIDDAYTSILKFKP